MVLESTTYPGTTDEDLRRTIEENSKLKAGVDFHLAFSPEREDPGNPHSVVATIPKIVGGFTPACLKKAMALYSHRDQAARAGLILSSSGSSQATGKYFSQRQHRVG